MYRQTLDYDEKSGRLELVTTYNSDYIRALAKEERERNGRGFSKKKTMRALGTVSEVDLLYWKSVGDVNATDYLATGDARALKRFLRNHKEYRTSEGGV